MLTLRYLYVKHMFFMFINSANSVKSNQSLKISKMLNTCIYMLTLCYIYVKHMLTSLIFQRTFALNPLKQLRQTLVKNHWYKGKD